MRKPGYCLKRCRLCECEFIGSTGAKYCPSTACLALLAERNRKKQCARVKADYRWKCAVDPEYRARRSEAECRRNARRRASDDKFLRSQNARMCVFAKNKRRSNPIWRALTNAKLSVAQKKRRVERRAPMECKICKCLFLRKTNETVCGNAQCRLRRNLIWSLNRDIKSHKAWKKEWSKVYRQIPEVKVRDRAAKRIRKSIHEISHIAKELEKHGLNTAV